MNRESQIAIAIPLRAAVWNWITTFPAEFNEAIRVRGKTEGAPERVFDLLYSMNLTSDERVFWPTLTILNCTTLDRLSSDFQTQFSGPTKTARKVTPILSHVPSDIDHSTVYRRRNLERIFLSMRQETRSSRMSPWFA